MPKNKKEKDEDFVPGLTRRAESYDPCLDKRGNHKQLMEIKRKKWNKSPVTFVYLCKFYIWKLF